MELKKAELLLEEKKLDVTVKEIRSQISELSKDLYDKETRLKEFQRMMWDNKAELDPAEMKSFMTSNEQEVEFLEMRAKKFKKLYAIQNKPYFARIDFKNTELNEKIYIGITNVQKDFDYYVYDWRSPICSLFYDYEMGDCFYESPEGKVNGNLILKRQYQIEDAKIKNIFDTNINIDDEVLQSVLADNSNEKMKNIVNTIQKEQNVVIREIKIKNLIVQGIAGSGKTSVALHRIAYLLYKIKNLNSNNVLIFSPNNVFIEYISNVLPELGEDNTMTSTFHEFASTFIKEYYRVESFNNFLTRYYNDNIQNNDLIKYKLNDDIINHLETYAKVITRLCKFIKDIEYKDIKVTKEELNDLLQNRYSKFTLFERFTPLAEKINNTYFKGRKQDTVRIKSLLLKSINMKLDIKEIYKDFYDSQIFLDNYKYNLNRSEHIKNLNKKVLNYEDSSLFIYLKFLLSEIPYKVYTKEVVIDEAQDYTFLQYKIIKKIFKNSSFTILGDINQTINPFYKYESLKSLKSLFDDTKYIELNKTYRSTPEIIEYCNNILNLTHCCAIRKPNTCKVCKYNISNTEVLIEKINYLHKKYKSVAIITKNDIETNNIYELIKDKIKNISKLDTSEEILNKDFVVISAYGAKGLEFDSVIIINNFSSNKYLLYVAASRTQHELIIFE